MCIRDRFKRLYNWIYWNLYYEYDPYIPTNTSYLKASFNDFWKMPNETIATYGGDCEDLALLVYSVLKDKGYETYLLGWYTDVSGHMAVLVKYNDNWFIVDPAGNWLNGYQEYFKIRIYVDSKNYMVVYLNPIHLSPMLKAPIIGTIAHPVWYDAVTGEEVESINLPRYTSLKQLLTDWKNYCKGDSLIPIVEYMLIDMGLNKKFNTIDELVEYLEQ